MQPILVPYHLDEHLPDLDVPIEPERSITADLPDGDPWARMSALYESVAETVAGAAGRGGCPVVMSGDCTTSLGVMAGLQRSGLEPAVVWFDAHGDLQTLETTASGYLGGIPLRILVGYRPELISSSIGLAPVAQERVVLVDARDLDPPEADFLAGSPIRRLSVDALGKAELPDGPLYLHLDLDVVDPEQLPGQLFPAPGGPSLADVAAAVGHVVDSGRVAAVGLACTWRPGHGSAQRAAAVAGALAGVGRG